jgi:histidine ammonia-lyase
VAAHAAIRRVSEELVEDRALYRDIAAVRGLLREGELIRAVEEAVGALS